MPLKICCILAIFLCLSPVLLAEDSSVADASAHDEQQKINPFAGYPLDSVCAVVAFVLLLSVLGKFAWKPMLAGLNARQHYIEKQIADAESTKKDANKVLADYRSKVDNIEYEGKQIIDRHTKQADLQGVEIIERAKEHTEEMKVKAHADIERQQNIAQAELWTQAGEIILNLGKEVFGKSLNEGDNLKLIENAIKQLSEEEEKERAKEQENS
ncbi:MAG: F0F1 ATP synthase subunit B [Planctomycetes bacterium]|nr:F0F1 ATP synthase subunit B [Planctomycetota bacterium]